MAFKVVKKLLGDLKKSLRARKELFVGLKAIHFLKMVRYYVILINVHICYWGLFPVSAPRAHVYSNFKCCFSIIKFGLEILFTSSTLLLSSSYAATTVFLWEGSFFFSPCAQELFKNTSLEVNLAGEKERNSSGMEFCCGRERGMKACNFFVTREQWGGIEVEFGDMGPI